MRSVSRTLQRLHALLDLHAAHIRESTTWALFSKPLPSPPAPPSPTPGTVVAGKAAGTAGGRKQRQGSGKRDHRAADTTQRSGSLGAPSHAATPNPSKHLNSQHHTTTHRSLFPEPSRQPQQPHRHTNPATMAKAGMDAGSHSRQTHLSNVSHLQPTPAQATQTGHRARQGTGHSAHSNSSQAGGASANTRKGRSTSQHTSHSQPHVQEASLASTPPTQAGGKHLQGSRDTKPAPSSVQESLKQILTSQSSMTDSQQQLTPASTVSGSHQTSHQAASSPRQSSRHTAHSTRADPKSATPLAPVDHAAPDGRAGTGTGTAAARSVATAQVAVASATVTGQAGTDSSQSTGRSGSLEMNPLNSGSTPFAAAPAGAQAQAQHTPSQSAKTPIWAQTDSNLQYTPKQKLVDVVKVLAAQEQARHQPVRLSHRQTVGLLSTLQEYAKAKVKHMHLASLIMRRMDLRTLLAFTPAQVMSLVKAATALEAVDLVLCYNLAAWLSHQRSVITSSPLEVTEVVWAISHMPVSNKSLRGVSAWADSTLQWLVSHQDQLSQPLQPPTTAREVALQAQPQLASPFPSPSPAATTPPSSAGNTTSSTAATSSNTSSSPSRQSVGPWSKGSQLRLVRTVQACALFVHSHIRDTVRLDSALLYTLAKVLAQAHKLLHEYPGLLDPAATQSLAPHWELVRPVLSRMGMRLAEDSAVTQDHATAEL